MNPVGPWRKGRLVWGGGLVQEVMWEEGLEDGQEKGILGGR